MSADRLTLGGIPIGVDDYTDVLVTDVVIRDGALYAGTVAAAPWTPRRITAHQRRTRLRRWRLLRRWIIDPGPPYRTMVTRCRIVNSPTGIVLDPYRLNRQENTTP